MYKVKSKRFLAAALSLVMLFSLVPANFLTVSADTTDPNKVLQIVTGTNQWEGATVSVAALGLELGQVYDFSMRVFTPSIEVGIVVQTSGTFTWIANAMYSNPDVKQWHTLNGSLNLTSVESLPADIQITKRGGTNDSEVATFWIDDFTVTNRSTGTVVFREDFEGAAHAFGPASRVSVVNDPEAPEEPIILDPNENRVMRVVTGINQWEGIRIAGADANLELGNRYQITFRAYTPQVAEGTVGLVFQTNSSNGWNWNMIASRTAAAFQPDGWYQMTGTLDLRDGQRPADSTMPILVMAKNGDSGVYDSQVATFYIDDFIVTNLATGEVVFEDDFQESGTRFANNGGTITLVPEAVIYEEPVEPIVTGEFALDVDSLYEIYEDYFMIGNIVNPGDFGTSNAALERYNILKHHFNALTFENDMKPDSMWGPSQPYTQPAVPTARLATVDGWISRMLADGFEVIGHTLVWHGQSPNWLNLSAGNRERAAGRVYKPYAEARANMELFINTIAGHWYEHPDDLYIHTWDVINEAVRRNSQFPVNIDNWGRHTIGAIYVESGEQWNSPWYMCYSTDAPEGVNPWDYVYDSFMLTRLADPSALLMYNDYNMHDRQKADMVTHMVNAVNLRWAQDTVNNFEADQHVLSVQDYLDGGGRLLIESIGLQTHEGVPAGSALTADSRFDNHEYAIQQFISTGASLSITELDVTVPGYSRGDRLSEEDEYRQAYHYARLFELFLRYSDHIDRVSFWGVNDNRSWRAEGQPLLFDSDSRTKLAYYAVADPLKFLDLHDNPPLPPKPEGKIANAYMATVAIPTGSDWAIAPIWEEAEVMFTDVRVQGTDENPAVADVRALWDEDNLYVLFEVTDSALRNGGSNPWENDSVEAFFSEGNLNTGGYAMGDGQYRVDFMNNQSFGSNPGNAAILSAAKIVEGRGYDVIMAIPFTVITPEVGDIIGFDAQVNDRNAADTGRANVMIWNDPTDNSWANPAFWGNLRLMGAPGGGDPGDEYPPGVPIPVWKISTEETIIGLDDAEVFTSGGPVSRGGGATLTVRKDTILNEVHGWEFLAQSYTAVEAARPAAADGLLLNPAVLGLEAGETYIWEITGRRTGASSANHRAAFGTVNAGGTTTINGAAVGTGPNDHPTRPGYFTMKRTITHTDAIANYRFYGVGSGNTTAAAGGFMVYEITVSKANPYVLYETDFSDGTPGLVGGGHGDSGSFYGVVADTADPDNNVLRAVIPSGITGNWWGFSLDGANTGGPAGANYRSTWVARRTAASSSVNARLRLATETGGAVSNWDITGQSQTLGTGWTTYTVGPYELDPGVGVQSWQFIRNNETWAGTMELNSVKVEVIEAPADELIGGWESNDTLPSLAQRYSRYFTIGNILDRLPSEDLEEMFLYQYNTVTMENAMKPGGMSPSKGVYTYDNADVVVDWANENGLEMIGHALLWHSQSAAWLTTDSAGQPLTRAEARENLEEFITNVGGHFAGRLVAWDVANEVFTNNGGSGAWTSNMRTDSPWWRAYNNGRNAAAGEQAWDFLYDAFMFARKADPGAKLIYNDFNDNALNKARNIRDMANELNAKWARDTVNNPQAGAYTGTDVEIVTAYLAAGGRILVESIGLQAHYGATTTIRSSNVNTDWVVENGLRIYATIPGITLHITELDITNNTGFAYNPVAQQRQYEQLFELFLEYADLIERVTFWGVSDVQSWRGTQSPTLFARPTMQDPFFRAKPAFHAVAEIPPQPVTFEDVEMSFDVRSESYAWSEKTMAVVIDLGEGRSARTADLTDDMFTAFGEARRINNNALVSDWGRHGTRVINRVYASEVNNWNNPSASGRYVVVEFKSWGGNIFNPGQGTALATHDGGQPLRLTYTITANADIPLADGNFIGTSASFIQSENSIGNHISPVIDQFVPGTITGNGVTTNYSRFINTEADGPLPLVIHLHGANQGSHWRQPLGYSNNATIFATPENQAKYPTHVLVPALAAFASAWTETHLRNVGTLVQQMIDEGLVDANRVYITGYSMGGTGTFQMLNLFPDMFAAAVPICPAQPTNAALNATNAPKYADIPIWVTITRGDSSFNAMNTYFSTGVGATILTNGRYTVYENNNVSSFPYGPDIWSEYRPHNEITADGYWIFNSHQSWIPTWNAPLKAVDGYTGPPAAGFIASGAWADGNIQQSEYDWMIDWLFAQERTFTVTFDSAGGSEVAPAVVLGGETVEQPEDPVRFGYTFAGWLLGGELFDFATPITSKITLTADWTLIPITSLRISRDGVTQAPAMIAVLRNSTEQFDIVINADALKSGIVWSVNNTNLATVTQDGIVTIKGVAGNVTLTARAPSGVTHSIVLRIA